MICSVLQEFVTQYASWRPLEKFVIVFSHEGIEGEVVRNLLLLASSFANKEFFFTHMEGDEYDEESNEEVSDKEERVLPAMMQNEVSINALTGCIHLYAPQSVYFLSGYFQRHFISDSSIL